MIRRTYRRVEVSLVRERAERPYHITSPAGVVALLHELIGAAPREHFMVVLLDTKHRPLAIHEVSIGTVDSSVVHPREVFMIAIALASTAIVVAHNHPSGDPSPSSNDRAITRRLRDAGELLGIPLLDHVVIGDDTYYSFADEQVHRIARSTP